MSIFPGFFPFFRTLRTKLSFISWIIVISKFFLALLTNHCFFHFDLKRPHREFTRTFPIALDCECGLEQGFESFESRNAPTGIRTRVTADLLLFYGSR